MDLGFEGDFEVPVACVNPILHQKVGMKIPKERPGLNLSEPHLKQSFQNDILRHAEAAWLHYFSKRLDNAEHVFHKESIVELVKKHRMG